MVKMENMRQFNEESISLKIDLMTCNVHTDPKSDGFELSLTSKYS